MIAVGERERKRAVGSFRGLRGGSWNNNENNLRSSNRNNNNPDNENNNIGFRVASPRETRRRAPGQNPASERAHRTVPYSGTTCSVRRVSADMPEWAKNRRPVVASKIDFSGNRWERRDWSFFRRFEPAPVSSANSGPFKKNADSCLSALSYGLNCISVET